MRRTRIGCHVAGIALTAAGCRAASILAGGPAGGRTHIMQLGVLIALPAFAAVGLYAIAIFATGRADRIADGIGAGPQLVALVAATATGAALTPTIYALLCTVGLARAAGPALRIARITLTDLWGNAATMATWLAADGLTDERIPGAGTMAVKAAAQIGTHTSAIDAGAPAFGLTIGLGHRLIASQAAAHLRTTADAIVTALAAVRLAMYAAAIDQHIALLTAAGVRRSAARIVATGRMANGCTAMRR